MSLRHPKTTLSFSTFTGGLTWGKWPRWPCSRFCDTGATVPLFSHQYSGSRSARWFNRVWGDSVPLFGRTHVVSAYVFSIDIKDLTVLCRNGDFSTQFEHGANGLTHFITNAHSIRSIRTCRKKSRIASINGVVGKRRKIGAPRSPLRTHRHD